MIPQNIIRELEKLGIERKLYLRGKSIPIKSFSFDVTGNRLPGKSSPHPIKSNSATMVVAFSQSTNIRSLYLSDKVTPEVIVNQYSHSRTSLNIILRNAIFTSFQLEKANAVVTIAFEKVRYEY